MEWVRREDVAALKTVNDFAELMEVYDREDLTEFQYTIEPDGRWVIHLK